MDLLFINDLEDQDYKIGLLVIDIFTKFMTVVPLMNKMADHVLEGIKKAIDNMGNYQKFYTQMKKVVSTINKLTITIKIII